jgi:outer membrane protein
VKKQVLWLPILAMGIVPLAHAQAGAAQAGKVGVIHIQNAIIRTQDGQKAAAELQTRFDPKKKELEQKQNRIASLRDQLSKGSNTMSEEAKQRLMRDIDQLTKALGRDTEDAQADFDQQQQKVLQELGGRLMAVIDKYARDNGYSLILDVSTQPNPVLYISNNIDITSEIVALYDKNAPSATTGTPNAAPAAKPPAAPAVRPATKK